MSQLLEASEKILRLCVAHVTGGETDEPRPGQLALMRDVVAQMEQTSKSDGYDPGQLCGSAPTGVGKSFAYLVPAAAAAALYQQRTVVSTEMIGLQTQIITKDMPLVARMCEEVTGYSPTSVVFKGWSNYVCRLAAEDEYDRLPSKSVVRDELVTWARDQWDAGGTGDKADYDGRGARDYWSHVSVSSQGCVGKRCDFFDDCFPRQARQSAATADIVVANHTLLAIQAVTGMKIVLGSKRIGHIHHLIVDEAHGLTSIVRSRGAVELSGPAFERTIKQIQSVYGDVDTGEAPQDVIGLVKAGSQVVAAINEVMARWRPPNPRDVLTLTGDDNPVGGVHELVEAWTKEAASILNDTAKKVSSDGVLIKIRRALAALEEVDTVLRSAEPTPNVARWVSTKTISGEHYGVFEASPVDVSYMLENELWWGAGDPEDTEEDKPTAVTPIAVSATLPESFPREMGLHASVKNYPSPFDDAYDASLLFIPRATEKQDVAALTHSGRKFDTGRHVDWAADYVEILTRENGGSALVLAANVRAGKAYAEQLRASNPPWTVLSQWDGTPLPQQVARWKDDPSAVLIGTRSLMTGVDAAGEACTLVIIDRPSRAFSNPVDDARVGALTQNGINRWVADRMVYVTDAAALLEQAAGRLIRTIDDSGMVAVLDPRLLKSSVFAYTPPVRRTYLKALRRFDHRTADADLAIEWLRERTRLRQNA